LKRTVSKSSIAFARFFSDIARNSLAIFMLYLCDLSSNLTFGIGWATVPDKAWKTSFRETSNLVYLNDKFSSKKFLLMILAINLKFKSNYFVTKWRTALVTIVKSSITSLVSVIVGLC